MPPNPEHAPNLERLERLERPGHVGRSPYACRLSGTRRSCGCRWWSLRTSPPRQLRVYAVIAFAEQMGIAAGEETEKS
ncbi:hypothetical protein AB0D12_37885 [Streptomyces sp. NPDC048479]|uniref:hypothetical protein n=1 Tax=Streptomyces sp. NPDC048479 TaxID=3154725 RepID=UPI00341A7122